MGHESLITAVVCNVLQFLDPVKVALHTSADSAIVHRVTPAGEVWSSELRPHAARLIANPVHVTVAHHNAGDVLSIHLLNIKLLLHTLGVSASDRVVLMPGNAVLFRPCAAILRASPMSFMPTFHPSFTDIEGSGLTRDNTSKAAASSFQVLPFAMQGAVSSSWPKTMAE